MIDSLVDTRSALNHDENGEMSAVVGVVLILFSIFLIILGTISQPQGQLVPVPNGNGGFDYIPSGGYSHPYESLVPIGILGTIAGLMLAVVGGARTWQKKSPQRNVTALSGNNMLLNIGRQPGSPASPPKLSVMTPSQPTAPHEEPKPMVGSTRGRYLGIRASELMVQSSAGLQATIVVPHTRAATPSRENVPWMVEFEVPRPRAYRIDLEQRLIQLRSWKERGLITKQNYEEERNKILRRLHVPHMIKRSLSSKDFTPDYLR